MGQGTASEVTAKPAALLGQCVAFTGRFATLSRERAAALVQTAGGRVANDVTPVTTMLVVGGRAWPLLESGRVTRKLADADRLRTCGQRIDICSEDEFRERVGLDPVQPERLKSLPLDQVAATVQLSPDTIVRWTRLGLIRDRDGLYDFQDLVSLRTIAHLVAKGVGSTRIRASLESLARLIPGVERPLSQLTLLVTDSGELAAEIEEAILTSSGQLEMNFEPRSDGSTRSHSIATPTPGQERSDIEHLIDDGVMHESQGELERAEALFRRAVELAPLDATAHFNLGNVLLAEGRFDAACERFEQAVSLDGTHARAWFNLAHAQEALGREARALESLRRAVATDEEYADAYYNLADLAQRLGERGLAENSWRAYLRLDPSSEWAEEARRRLRDLRGPAWA